MSKEQKEKPSPIVTVSTIQKVGAGMILGAAGLAMYSTWRK